MTLEVRVLWASDSVAEHFPYVNYLRYPARILGGVMKDPYVQTMAASFEDEMKKLAGLADTEAKAGKGILSFLTRKEVALPVAGAVGYKVLSDAERDRRMGRQIRKQNPGY